MTKTLKTSYLLLSCALSALTVGLAHAQDVPAEDESERKLNTVQVRGEFIPEPQRATSQVATFLAPEDLARQGDSNAALALTRLSGISIVSDKFAYVRGLGDRYSSALLNGSPLPSPEPLRRTVPLDLFPSNALDGATVQKTYSAKYPGEFGGGVIDLKTLRQPSEDFFNVKLGTGYNTETNSTDGLFVRGSDSDWSGYDDGLRDIPAEIGQLLSSGQNWNTFDDATVEAAGESLVNSPLSVLQTGDVDPDFDGEVEFGKVLDYGRYDVGIIGVAGFSSGWTTKERIRQRVDGGTRGNDFETLDTTYTATVNALGGVTFNFADHLLQGTVFYVHDTDKEAQLTTGFDFNAQDELAYYESSGWYERALLMGQLGGEHMFGDLTLSWRGSLAESTRDAPYQRELRRYLTAPESEGGVPAYLDENSYTVDFSYLTDNIASFGGEGVYEKYFDGKEAIFSAGFDYSNTEREFESYPFRFEGGNSIPVDVQTARPDYLFSPDNIDPTRFVLDERGSRFANYDGELEISALFGEADVELTSFIRATVGVRYEEGEQTVVTSGRTQANTGSTIISNEYLLPAISLTWNFAEDLQLRTAYSQTVSRPQFRELAPSIFTDPDSDRQYRGNLALLDSEFKNFDARLEYYMGKNQFVTLSAFFKEIENPIEETQISTASFEIDTGFINAPKADLYGTEFEYRTRFAFPVDTPFFNDRDGLFSVNYTYTKSEISADEGDTVANPLSFQPVSASLFNLDGAQLQGTPENILNLQLGWESDVEQLTVLLGWVDERILQRGNGANLPDIIEDPGVQLDIVYNRDFVVRGHDLTLGLRARNLLNEAHEEFQTSVSPEGDSFRTEFNTYDRGTSLSASLTAKF